MIYPLEKQMYKNIVRILKENKYYAMFMKIITNNTLNPFNGLVQLKSKCPIQSNFSECENLQDLYKRMQLHINNETTLEEKDAKKLQTVVAMYVNVLLHECVEPYLTQAVNMEELGRQCFNRCCESIYGKNFKDETEEPSNSLPSMKKTL